MLYMFVSIEGSREEVTVYTVRDKFMSLAQTQFIMRSPPVIKEEVKKSAPTFNTEEADRLFDVPKADLSGMLPKFFLNCNAFLVPYSSV